MTPFQRMTLLEAIKEKNEKEQEAANGNGNSGGAGHGQVNSLRQPGGGRGQTKKFVNTHTEPEESE